MSTLHPYSSGRDAAPCAMRVLPDQSNLLVEGAGSSECGGEWPTRRSPVLTWLINDTVDERYLDRIFAEFCRRLTRQGFPLTRSSLMLHIQHPRWRCLRVSWTAEQVEPELNLTETEYADGNATDRRCEATLRAGADEIRIRGCGTASINGAASDAGPRLEAGLTDHVAWPLSFTLGSRQIITFSTARPGGFTRDELLELSELLPALSNILEVRLKNRLLRDLLDAYVGPHASGEILTGAVHRGDGFTITAAIMVVDLRGFTSISELWPRNDVIAMLNDYFDALSEPIEACGGEILKFMGDGLLAIFPDNPASARDAVIGIRTAMVALNAVRTEACSPVLEFGIGVNYGDVMYGNIGSKRRLDFTVIGPAVNVASRLEALNKVLGRSALFSAAFAASIDQPDALTPCGTYGLRGVTQPLAVYCLPEEAACDGSHLVIDIDSAPPPAPAGAGCGAPPSGAA